jgi:hypothetical protein
VRVVYIKHSRLVRSITSHLGWTCFRNRCRRGVTVSQRRIGHLASQQHRAFGSLRGLQFFTYSGNSILDPRGIHVVFILARLRRKHKFCIASWSSSRPGNPRSRIPMPVRTVCIFCSKLAGSSIAPTAMHKVLDVRVCTVLCKERG